MKKAYLLRCGAYGDHIHMTNVIKALDQEGYHITFEYNYKGAQIHSYNPRVDTHIMTEPSWFKTKDEYEAWGAGLQKKINQYDLFVNFGNSLETTLIDHEDVPAYFWPIWMRRDKNTNICYYDQSMIWAGLTDKKYMGWHGELFYKKWEHEHVLGQLKPYENKKVILWAMRGTMWQKAVCHIARGICDDWLKEHPDTVIITTGDDFCHKWEWPSAVGTTIAPDKGLGDGTPSVVHKSARMPFRQALLMAKYVDLVVTPETGLGIGAGAFGTAKIMMLTAASLKNIVGNDENDFSIQSDAWCSPCTRAIYNTRNCPINPETDLPICVDFKKDVVLAQMEKALFSSNRAPWVAPDKGVSA